MESMALVVALMVGGLVLLLVLRWRRRRQASRKGSLRTGLPPHFEGRELKGSPYGVALFHRGNGNPATLSYGANTLSGLDLHIRRETAFDRLGKRLGIAREFQTGNPIFDARWYLECNIGAELGEWLKREETQHLIKEVTRVGFDVIWHDRGWLQADWLGFDANRNRWPPDAAIAALCRLASSMPAGESKPEPERMRLATKLPLACGLLALIVFHFTGTQYPSVRGGEPWPQIFAVGLIGAGLFAALAGGMLRGRAGSHLEWRPMALAGLVANLIGSFGLMTTINGAGDTSPAIVRQEPVIDFRIERGSSPRGVSQSDSYWITVRDWKDGGELHMTIDRDTFARVERGARLLEITTHAGRLGVEWTSGFRLLVPPPEPPPPDPGS